MCPPSPPSDGATPAAPVSGRRRFLRIALGATVVGGAGARLLYEVVRGEAPHDAERPAEPVTVLDACLGCLGCAILCPTGAIAIVPGGISIDAPKCTRCGYCLAACPVNGVRVNGER